MIPGLHTQINVVGAVLLRETRTRFGAHQLGYLWALVSPMVTIAMFAAMISIGGRTSPDGMTAVGFLATGLITFQLFSSTLDKCISAIASNRALLFYPQVLPLDLVIARSLLEIATLLAVFIILLGGDGIWQGSIAIDSLLRTLIGLALAGALGASVGLILCAASVFSKVIEQLHGPLFRPLFWISGIFFTANDLPTPALKLLRYNPLLHATELVRDGWFPSYSSRIADPGYILWWVLGSAFIGLSLERMARRKIQLT